MKIVVFAHPEFLGQESMPRFAKMIVDGMSVRGHHIEVWSPTEKFFKLSSKTVLKKWFGYVDQYIVFPYQVMKRLKKEGNDTLFVFTDHALGPYVPLVSKRRHVVHCHDFLAQRSALGEIRENRLNWSDKLYQAFIRRGFRRGKNFISVSERTREDLHRFLDQLPVVSKVIYNGLNKTLKPFDKDLARAIFGGKTGYDFRKGYIIHVGGNSWYKNRRGVLEIYEAWRDISQNSLPLVMVGKQPDKELFSQYKKSQYKKDIHFLTNIHDDLINMAYAGASLLLFPSLAEGFGWPIAEAMACGCPVVTTNEPPMTEVAGNAAFLIPRRPDYPAEAELWAFDAGKLVDNILHLSREEYQRIIKIGLENVKRFDPSVTLNCFEAIYYHIV